jgi:hypothetical protein
MGVASLAGVPESWGYVPRDLNPHVSEDRGLPIGHPSDIALTTAFVLGGPR